MGIIITIAIISGIITLINALGSIGMVSKGETPQLGGEMAIVFVLVMYLFVGWWTLAIALFILFIWLFIIGLYNLNK